jgi:hypothetical protein
MSVDTTTVILRTISEDEQHEYEYRVKCIQAAENLFEYGIVSRFENVPVVYTYDEAIALSEVEEEKHMEMMGYYSEYGTYEHFVDKTFSHMMEGEQNDGW